MKRISDFKKLDIILSLTTILFFFYMFFKYMVNVPINDDYSVLDNFNGILNAESFLEKAKLFFAQHNEHRIVYDKIWFLISYVTYGQIDFNLLSLVGNLSLIGVFIVLAKRASLSHEYILLFPMAVLLFNLTFWENMTFAMAGLSNYTVVLFSLLSLSFLAAKELSQTRFTLAILFCFLAILTQGGGLLVIPVSLLILLLKKDYSRLKTYGFLGALFVVIYFVGYEAPQDSPSITESLINFKVRSVLFSLAFLGSSFSFSFYNTVNISDNQSFAKIVNDTMMLNAVVGFIFVAAYAYLVKTQYYRKNLFNFSVMTLIIAISIVTGITRSQLGIETSYASRYRILSTVFVICLIVKILEYAQTHKINTLKVNGIVLLLSGLFFYHFNYSQEEYLYDRKKQVLKGVLNYHSGNHKLLYGLEQNFCKTVLENSNKNKTYYLLSKKELEKEMPYASYKKIDANELFTDSASGYVEEVTPTYDGYYIEGWAYLQDQKTDKQKVYIGIGNAAGQVFYQAQPMHRYDLNSYFHKEHLENGGFYARIKAKDVAAGENNISICIENKGSKKIIMSDKVIVKP